MRLSDFLVSQREPILSAWVAFARSCRVAPNGDESQIINEMSVTALRDHASAMLDVIAADLRTPQTKTEQADKSKGKSDAEPESAAPDTAAQAHGADRADSGFTMEEMVSEYRALRASVIRLWLGTVRELHTDDFDDLIRFNEAIDQALAESTSRFVQNIDQSKEIFLGMLGHDLRNPLGAILGSAHILLESKELPQNLSKAALLVLKSGRRMNALVGDLLDFTRSRLGSGIPITRASADLREVCRSTVDEISAMYPQRVLHVDASGELHGEWDSARVSQALSNVLSNAVDHGSDTHPISITLRGDADGVEISVQNWGPVIPADQLDRVFAPMHRVDGDKPGAPTSNLGLGLYITERIVAAHAGTIDVESSDEKGTTFTICLPKRVAA
jgi:signal transduction histidine kinase